MIAMTGRVHNAAQVSRAIGRAPDLFRKKLLGGLLSERDQFVGSKGKDGVFTKKIMRKTSMKGTPWPRNIARIFGGRVDGGERIEGMRLVMGVGESKRFKYRHKEGYGIGLYSGMPFTSVIDFLSTGGTIQSRNKEFMIMPIYRNFQNKKKIGAQWKSMIANHELAFVREGNRLYYFRKNGYGDDRDLLFIGIKSATVKRQYDFYGDWNKRLPRVGSRLQKKIDKAVDIINKGK